MSMTKGESRYSLGGVAAASGTSSRSPTKGGRRTIMGDTAASRRPVSTADRPEERVRVFLRVRPSKAEGETPGALRLKAGGGGVVVYREHASIPCSDFEFDGVLGPGASQSDVYHAAVKPIVEDVLNGYNGTLMAYGQTGAGKTYTLSSIAADAIGMIPRVAAEIFSHVEGDSAHEYSVYMSYVQLYMELIQDLLRPESESLQIRENEGGVFVGGVHQQEVSNITQCLHLLHLGDRNRTTAFTALNAHSSRSHAVVMLTVIKRRSVGAVDGDAEIQRVKVGKLFLVDLAGSERLKKSKSTGLRASEAKSINLSLTTLGMCINARADPNATHVPFRDSKLTRLLQDSLGGNAKTSLLVAACDAQEHVEETLQTLQFGARAMCVRIQAVVNERVDYKSLESEMIAALETKDRKSSLLEASLLEKDAQLEAVQAQLQREQSDAARMADELQREREAAEAERQQLLAEREAVLAAETQHKEALLQKLQTHSQAAQDQAAAAEAAQQQLLQRLDEQAGQLAEAATAALAAEERHAADLETARAAAAEAEARHAEALEEARRAAQAEAARVAAAHEEAHEEALAAVAGEAAAAFAAAQEELTSTQRLLVGSREESRILQEHNEQQLKDLEEEWAGKVREADAAGQRAAAAGQAEVAARDRALDALQAELCGREDRVEHLEGVVAALEGGKAELARQVAAQQAQLAAAAERQQQLEAALAGERHAVRQLQAQVEGYERSRMNLAKSFFENKVRSDAARVIQRTWREHHMRRMRQQQTEGYNALNNAKTMLGTLAQQHADLEQRRRANLAFSGQTLVGDNLDVLQDAVESIIGAFLLPARDLKTLQRYQQKVSAYSAATMPRQQPHPSAPSVLAPSGGDRIKALYASQAPLGDSRPGSARSTPRAHYAGSAGDASPPPAPLGQQLGAAAYAGSNPALSRQTSAGSLAGGAPSQQQQQYAQPPPQQQQQYPLQQQQQHAAPAREGSLRGGLANLAALAKGSPLDRLRRLSSGFQQQGQQPGQYYR